MNVDDALEVLKDRGPRGGDLNIMPTNGKREWRQAELRGEVMDNGELGLHRFTETTAPPRKDEQPWHRMAAYMLNAGCDNSTIAASANVAEVTVSQLRGQKWFQQLCAVIANGTGKEILGAVKGYALEAVEGIHKIATSAESDRVRLSAYQLLLEHAEGKPVQKVISNVTHNHNMSPTEEMQAINEELAALRGQRN